MAKNIRRPVAITRAALLALVCLSCGDEVAAARARGQAEEALVAQAAGVGALIDARGRRICTATAVGPRELVTSARCARAAGTRGLAFVAGLKGVGAAAPQRGRVAAGRVPDGAAGSPPLPGGGRELAALARYCGVPDLLALDLSAEGRLCALRAAPATDLTRLGLAGLGRWRDQGIVVLEAPMDLEPALVLAPPAAGASPPRLWLVGTRAPREAGSAPRAYAQRWREVARNAAELHAEADGGPAWVDVGAALFAEVAVDGDLRLALVGVASRPWLAHGDASAGVIFSLLAPSPSPAAAL